MVACAGQWTPTTPLPDGYTDHALAFSSGYLYQLGGNGQTNGIMAGFTAHFAQFHADGSIGAWSNTTALPVATTYHAGVAANGYLYVLGGYDYSDSRGVFITDAVYYSKINTDGTIGAWLTANPLPSPVYSLAAAVWNGRIYVSGGYDETNVSAAVYSCRIQADGSLSPWLARPPLPEPLFAHASVANGALYVVGGLKTDGSTASTNVYRSGLNSDGSLAGWTLETSTPSPVAYPTAVAAGGKLYVMGGLTGTNAANEFWSAVVISANGTLGSWSAGPVLPTAVADAKAALTGTHIILSGGSTGNFNATNAVYSMPLPSPPAPPVLDLTQHSGGTVQIRLAADPNTGFGLLASANSTNWIRINAGVTDASGVLQLQDNGAAGLPCRFYRGYWPLP